MSTPSPPTLQQPPATPEDVEKFIADNRRWIDDPAASELRGMNPQDQRRVIAGGTIVSCRDASGVIRSRVRQAREKEALLAGAARNDGNSSANVAVITPGGGGRLSKPATKEELETFIASNRRWLNEEGEQILRAMSPLDQKRVIAAGTMSGCRDPIAVVQTRAKRAREMEMEFEQLTKGKQKQEEKAEVASIPVPKFSVEAAVAYVYVQPQEVAKEESKFAFAHASQKSQADDPSSGGMPLMGETKGIGGVVETLKAKYGCARGQRLKVLGETATLWQFEGGKTAPKNHEGSGFRWIFKDEEEARLAAKAEVRRKEELALQRQLQTEHRAKEEAEAFAKWDKEHRKESDGGPPEFNVEDSVDADVAQLLALEWHLAAFLQRKAENGKAPSVEKATADAPEKPAEDHRAQSSDSSD